MLQHIKHRLFKKTTPPPSTHAPKLTVGWQEWCALPKLSLPAIKAKIDTGAKTSALHAWDLKCFHRHGDTFVHFIVHPLQRNNHITQVCTARVIDQRVITSSTGQKELRYIIATPIILGPMTWEIEISLANRDTMAFRMLLGRDALKNHAIINPGKILYQGRLHKKMLNTLYTTELKSLRPSGTNLTKGGEKSSI